MWDGLDKEPSLFLLSEQMMSIKDAFPDMHVLASPAFVEASILLRMGYHSWLSLTAISNPLTFAESFSLSV
eukprot:scaffold96870_cov21-Tisochrysis_lutea.AAC.3